MTDSLHSSRYTTQIKNEKNTLMPLQSRSHIGIYLFSFRFYEYVFHCFPHIYTKKTKLFRVMFPSICIFLRCYMCFYYLVFGYFIKKNRVFEFPVIWYKTAYILWFSIFSGYPHAIYMYFIVERKIFY